MTLLGREEELLGLITAIKEEAKAGIERKHKERADAAKKMIDDIYRRKVAGIKNHYRQLIKEAKERVTTEYMHKSTYEVYTAFLDEINTALEEWVQKKIGDEDYVKNALKKAKELLGGVDEVICSKDFFTAELRRSSMNIKRIYGKGTLIFKRDKRIMDLSPQHVAEVFQDDIIRDVMDVVEWER